MAYSSLCGCRGHTSRCSAEKCRAIIPLETQAFKCALSRAMNSRSQGARDNPLPKVFVLVWSGKVSHHWKRKTCVGQSRVSGNNFRLVRETAFHKPHTTLHFVPGINSIGVEIPHGRVGACNVQEKYRALQGCSCIAEYCSQAIGLTLSAGSDNADILA